ncbi:aminoglycoside phosphotransferase family protein [Marinomonas rhizomae]|uniref:Phosphotransferase family enzyme n=1 Tax=Marinomonas rhizomae TaxID=491948 RepID=A0A366JAS5_9GAMM|nr:phosphotransferase [Marinomonas rhizomae]RBP83967.1 phosphotransferase family enzyme [Marinomonas rhizomae]RNF73335.1 aminoglycoside phosphotransferase family protein [Marinomonas rhizomae]
MPSTPVVATLQEHVSFLLHEVETHCHIVELFFTSSSTALLSSIRGRRGYVQALREKADIETARLLERRKANTTFHAQVSGMHTLVIALEMLTKHCFDCVREGTLEEAYEHPAGQECRKLVKRIRRALRLVKVGVSDNRRRTGIKLGRRTHKLLASYNELQALTLQAKFDLSDDQLRAAILSNVSVKRLIEQLGVVAEALIKADLGQVATLQNYPHLLDSATNLNYDLRDLKVRRLALTRSGSAIAAITHKDESGNDVLAVYKEGDRSKIEEEVAGVNQWRDIDPRLAPSVLCQTGRSQINGKSDGSNEQSSLLIEHIPGQTLEALLLAGDKGGTKAALKVLFKTLNQTWKASLTPESCSAKFMQQLQKRIGDSRKVHPEFFKDEERICGYTSLSFDELVRRVAIQEAQWRAPFSVLTHGDFNVDNLIYDDAEKRVYFIDLHRASYFDYVQDLSVLMVSIYRLQVLSGETRTQMMESAKEVYRFGRRFAARQQDVTFEVRLAAGLARSFATSTRFIFDKKLASRMHLRARYLLERLAKLSPEQGSPEENTSEQVQTFTLPLKELYVE